MSTFITCPDCGVPAEVIDQFVLASTEGPVQHVTLLCARGHRYQTAADLLPEPGRRLLEAEIADSRLSRKR